MANRRNGDIDIGLLSDSDYETFRYDRDCKPYQYAVLLGILFFTDHYFCVNGCYFESIYTDEAADTGIGTV